MNAVKLFLVLVVIVCAALVVSAGWDALESYATPTDVDATIQAIEDGTLYD